MKINPLVWILAAVGLAIAFGSYIYDRQSNPFRYVHRAADAGDANQLLEYIFDSELRMDVRRMARSSFFDMIEDDKKQLRALAEPFTAARDQASDHDEIELFAGGLSFINEYFRNRQTELLLERASLIVPDPDQLRQSEVAKPYPVDLVLGVSIDRYDDGAPNGEGWRFVPYPLDLEVRDDGLSARLSGLTREEILAVTLSVERLGIVYGGRHQVGNYEGDCDPNLLNGAYQRYAHVYVVNLVNNELESSEMVYGSDPPKWSSQCVDYGSYPALTNVFEFSE